MHTETERKEHTIVMSSIKSERECAKKTVTLNIINRFSKENINYNRSPWSASSLILSGLESKEPSFAISFSRSRRLFPSCSAPINASSMFFRRSWIFDKKFFTASISIGSNVSLHAISRAFILSRHSSARLYIGKNICHSIRFHCIRITKEDFILFCNKIKRFRIRCLVQNNRRSIKFNYIYIGRADF